MIIPMKPIVDRQEEERLVADLVHLLDDRASARGVRGACSKASARRRSRARARR